MGSYASKLSRRLRGRAEPKVIAIGALESHLERLVCVGIMREGQLHGRGERCRSHANLRQWLGDADPYQRRRGDIEGFFTDTGRFVDRREAGELAYKAGQTSVEHRNLLSSEVNW